MAFPLSTYLEIVPSNTAHQLASRVEVDGKKVCLRIPLDQWPSELRSQWQQELFYLFPAETRIGRVDAKDCVTLCHEVLECPRKVGKDSEDRSCPHFNQGICMPTTTVANDFHPLSFGTIGAFHGISKQRVQQIYRVAQKKVIRAAARDPILREYYTSLGMCPENLPDPRRLATNMEKLLE